MRVSNTRASRQMAMRSQRSPRSIRTSGGRRGPLYLAGLLGRINLLRLVEQCDRDPTSGHIGRRSSNSDNSRLPASHGQRLCRSRVVAACRLLGILAGSANPGCDRLYTATASSIPTSSATKAWLLPHGSRLARSPKVSSCMWGFLGKLAAESFSNVRTKPRSASYSSTMVEMLGARALRDRQVSMAYKKR